MFYVNWVSFLFCNLFDFAVSTEFAIIYEKAWYFKENRVLKNLLEMLITIWRIIIIENYVTFFSSGRSFEIFAFCLQISRKKRKKYVLRGEKKAERREQVTVLYRW